MAPKGSSGDTGPSLLSYSLGTRRKLLPKKIVSLYREMRKAGTLNFFTVPPTAQISANIRYKQLSVNNSSDESSPCSYCPVLLSCGYQLPTIRISLGGDGRRKKVMIPTVDFSGNWVFGGPWPSTRSYPHCPPGYRWPYITLLPVTSKIYTPLQLTVIS